MGKLKRLLIFVVIALVLGGVYYVVFETTVFHVSEINYTPHQAMDIFDLERYSGIHYGDLIFEVNTDASIASLSKHPYVKSVTISKTYPNKVDIDIVYREHFMNIMYSDIILSLDNTLQVLKVIDEEEDGYTVEGMPFDAFSTGKVIDVDAFYILENIVKLVDLLNQTTLTVDHIIHFEDNNVYIYCGTIKANFGDAENIESRFNKFISIYESLSSNDIRTGIIDVSSDGLPVYRPFGE